MAPQYTSSQTDAPTRPPPARRFFLHQLPFHGPCCVYSYVCTYGCVGGEVRSCAEGNVTRDGAGRGGSGEFFVYERNICVFYDCTFCALVCTLFVCVCYHGVRSLRVCSLSWSYDCVYCSCVCEFPPLSHILWCVLCVCVF